MTSREIRQECREHIDALNCLIREHDDEGRELRKVRDGWCKRLEQFADYLPENLAPPADSAGPEYEPYAEVG